MMVLMYKGLILFLRNKFHLRIMISFIFSLITE